MKTRSLKVIKGNQMSVKLKKKVVYLMEINKKNSD